jgi:hypothetical protein
VGFLSFLHKKKGEQAEDTLEMPPIPSPQGTAEFDLPSFPEDKGGDDLKLPELPDLDSFNDEQSLQSPPDMRGPSLPAFDELEQSPAKANLPKPGQPIAFPKMIPDSINAPGPEPPYVEQKPQHMMPPPLHHDDPRQFSMPQRLPTGEVFVRGEDFRDILKDVDGMLTGYRARMSAEAKDLKGEHAPYDKLISSVEDLQRQLIITERMLFD